MVDTTAALTIALDAKVDKILSEMKRASFGVDKEATKIAKTQQKLQKQLSNWTIKLPNLLLGGAALYGVERFVSSIVEAGSKIKDTSDATGVGTDELQAWGLLADRAGTSQEDFNGALQKFAKNLGEAAIKGGDSAKMYRALGIDLHAGPTAAFYELADAVSKAKDPQQQVAIVTQALGKSAAKLTPILAQGSAALKAQTAELVKSGQVIKSSAIDKLDDLGDAWSDLKRQFLATGGNALAEPLSKITEALKDPEVQSSLKTFANVLADVAIAAAKVAKYAPVLAGMWAGAKIGRFAGPEGILPGAAVGGLAALAGKALLKSGEPAAATGTPAGGKPPNGKGGAGGTDYSDILGQDAQKRKDGAKQLADFETQNVKGVRDATLRANEDIRQDNLDTADARRDEIKAQDQALLQLDQGTSGYYALQKAVINELANLDIQSIGDRKDADLAALKARAEAADKQDADEVASRQRQLVQMVEQEKITQAQADKSIEDLKASQLQERAQRETADASRSVALEQTTADQIKAINEKKNADLAQADEDLYHTRQNQIALNDGIRQGLIDIGTAGLHGFGSMKDAAAQALDQIAQMILQMYVLKPLVESILGPMGTTSGGLFGGGDGIGSVIGKVFGFANGGVMTPTGPMALKRFAGGGTSSQAAIFGEAGPEAAVPLPDGRRIPVELRMPSMPAISARPATTLTVVNQFNLDGSVVTDDIIARAQAAGAMAGQSAIKQYDKHVLPYRVADLRQNPRKR